MEQKVVLISINAAWNVFNFRKALVAALREQGYRVLVAAPPDEYCERIEAMGAGFIPIAMDSKGVSPFQDLRLLGRYLQLLRQVRPDIFLGYTAKPNIYGSLAAAMLGIPVINNIAGLGTAFIRQNWLTGVLTRLYRLALHRSATVFFQNPEDRDLFLSERMVRPEQVRLLPGSGVDLAHFSPSEDVARSNDGFRFLLMGRVLWDKGVGEYVEAARIVRRVLPEARFQMLGFADSENRTAVPRAVVEGWVSEGIVEYLGQCDDVRRFVAAADCIVLPSYREGLPKSLLEAAAMAKPLIATDVPGCRHVVEHGKNGFLCAVRDAQALSDAMIRMAQLSSDERRALGTAGRQRMESEFDESLVAQHYLAAIEDAITGNP